MKILDSSAAQLATQLIAKHSIRWLETETGINRGTLSKIASGMSTGEDKYRTLARLAISEKICCEITYGANVAPDR